MGRQWRTPTDTAIGAAARLALLRDLTVRREHVRNLLQVSVAAIGYEMPPRATVKGNGARPAVVSCAAYTGLVTEVDGPWARERLIPCRRDSSFSGPRTFRGNAHDQVVSKPLNRSNVPCPWRSVDRDRGDRRRRRTSLESVAFRRTGGPCGANPAAGRMRDRDADLSSRSASRRSRSPGVACATCCATAADPSTLPGP